MRAKFLIPLLALSCALIAFLWLRVPRPATETARGAPPPVITPESAASKQMVAYSAATPAPALAAGQRLPEDATNHQAYVEKRVAELQDLAVENDPASLAAILSELTNRDRDVRAAAIEAAVQFGSRDAIPGLMEAAAQIDDFAQRAEINKAIAYLKLPAISEVQPAPKR
jgi:hypothetical protein